MFLQISRKEAMFTSAASNLPCSCGIENFFRLDLEIDRSSATAQPPLLNTLAWDEEEAHRGWSRNRRKLTPGMVVLSPPDPRSLSDTVTVLKTCRISRYEKSSQGIWDIRGADDILIYISYSAKKAQRKAENTSYPKTRKAPGRMGRRCRGRQKGREGVSEDKPKLLFDWESCSMTLQR